MLETIYEADENIISNDDNDGSAKFIEQPFRLSYYICWSVIMGFFLTLTLIIVISLNPFLLSKTSINKNSKNISNIPINSDDILKLSKNIIKYLGIFSRQINEQLDLQPNTITFFTSTILDSSLENQNQSGILWIYSYLEYPQLCIDNNQCKDNFNLKLKTSFKRLSNFLSIMGLHSYYNKQIQLDWCKLIVNSTRAILVSLVSITNINQSAAEPTMIEDRIICQNIDQNILLSKTIDDIMRNDNQKLTIKIDFNTGRLKTKPTDCSKYNQRKETTQCSNDIDTQILLMWNPF